MKQKKAHKNTMPLDIENFIDDIAYGDTDEILKNKNYLDDLYLLKD